MTLEILAQSLAIASALFGLIKKLYDEQKRRKGSERLLYKMSLRVGEEPFYTCPDCKGKGYEMKEDCEVEVLRKVNCDTCKGTRELGYFTGEPNYKKLGNGL